MNSKQKKRAYDLLDETVAHYTLKNRCLDSQSNRCIYIPTNNKSEGCAIGRKLPKRYKKEILKRSLNIGVGVRLLFKKLGTPKVFSGIDGRVLEGIQGLHDSSLCWTSEGLSDWGKKKYLEIKSTIQDS